MAENASRAICNIDGRLPKALTTSSLGIGRDDIYEQITVTLRMPVLYMLTCDFVFAMTR